LEDVDATTIGRRCDFAYFTTASHSIFFILTRSAVLATLPPTGIRVCNVRHVSQRVA
jgi:hypothetical protein